jgi:hypothetical protein
MNLEGISKPCPSQVQLIFLSWQGAVGAEIAALFQARGNAARAKKNKSDDVAGF